VTQPVRAVIAIPEHEGWIGIMPAVYGGFMGAKLVTVYPANAKTYLPTHQAVIQLFSSLTSEPLATIDGRLITEMRTAAVSAIATNLLASPEARILAILGSGVQARSHLHALSLVRSFGEVRVWSPTHANAQRFAAETGAIYMPTAEAAVRDADVIVTATNAAEPILRGEWLNPDAYVNAMGAVGPTKRELDTAAMRASIVVESRASALVESGDILLAGASIYAELGELLADPQRPKPPGRCVYKSLGIAIEDLICAQLVYEALK
jgi:thiomorpholine-carboxylate dehydrogenase